MGLLDKVLGGGQKQQDYPELPSDHYARSRLTAMEEPLRSLFADIGDENLEVVPAENNAYAFVGNPPKKFGLAWIHDGRVTNLAAIAEERKINPIKMERIQDELTEAYRKSSDAERYKAEVAGREVVVIPSERLEAEVHRIATEIVT